MLELPRVENTKELIARLDHLNKMSRAMLSMTKSLANDLEGSHQEYNAASYNSVGRYSKRLRDIYRCGHDISFWIDNI